ncbi:hypothetical protein [Amycolatopsis anabasis]|uniref:hypothetical protein n=1 Tax=Amycolatopsis anabasis TaxID=1840409 RepID=UPI00131E713D|nr:hypothetical protein [Amycolatopsis anabasis]
MRKTFAAAALVAATFGGIAAGTGAANADQPATGTDIEQSTSEARQLGGGLGDLPVVGPLINSLLGGKQQAAQPTTEPEPEPDQDQDQDQQP